MEQKIINEQALALSGPKEAQSGKFAQSYTYVPENEEILAKRGKMYAVVEVRGGPEIDLNLAGKMVWDSLNEEYYSDLTGPPLSSLEKALSLASSQLLALAQKEKEKGTAETYYDLSLAVAVAWGEVVYVARVGEPAVFLERGRHVRKLLTEETPSGVASGIAQERDVLLLGSKTLRETFPPNLETIELLEKEFGKKSEVAGMAGIILKISLTAPLEPLKIKTASGERLAPSFPWAKLAFRQKLEGMRDKISIKLPALNLKIAIGVLALFFAVSVAFSIWQAREQAKKSEFSRLTLQIEEKITEAEGLVDFNNARAYEIYNGAYADFGKAKALLPSDPKVSELSSKLADVLSRIEKATEVTEQNLYFDLSLIFEGAKIISLSASADFLFALDEKSGSAFKIAPAAPPVGSEITPVEGKGAKYLASDGTYVYLAGPEGFARVNIGTSAVQKNVLSYDKFPAVSGIDEYSGNIYFLVPSDKQVYRFLVIASGYGAAKTWIKDGSDLSGAVDLSIDGGIWVLEPGNPSYFFGGEKDPFSISGLAVPISSAQKIFKKDYTQNVYVLEPAQGRILVFGKDGRFLRQFKGEMLKNAADLAVSSDEKTLYFASGSKIYRVGL